MKSADFTKSVAIAVNLKDVPNKNMLPKGNPGAAIIAPFVEAAEGAVIELGIAADVKLSIAVLFNDKDKAEDARKLIDGGVAAAKLQLGQQKGEIKELIDAFKVTSDGKKMTMNTKFKLKPLLKEVEAFLPLIMQGQPPRKSEKPPME
jgi:hypothetical protein